MTTNPGKFLAAAPKPYTIHEPILGRPAICEPVCRKVTAGSWLIASVKMLFTMAILSTILAVCGSNSLTHAPFWPCWANWNRDGTTGNVDCVDDIPVNRWPIRIDSGNSVLYLSTSRGL